MLKSLREWYKLLQNIKNIKKNNNTLILHFLKYINIFCLVINYITRQKEKERNFSLHKL